MEIVYCEQGSKEWDDLRARRMTGSHGQTIAANGKGLITYITEKMERYFSANPKKKFISQAMDEGTEKEDKARFLYEIETGVAVEEVGFVIWSEYVGVSPDGLVGDIGMAEIKCPEDKEYFRLLRGGAVQKKHIWQMQMQMMCCNRRWCDYIVFSPNYRKNLLITRVHADENMWAELLVGIEAGKLLIEEITLEINDQFKSVPEPMVPQAAIPKVKVPEVEAGVPEGFNTLDDFAKDIPADLPNETEIEEKFHEKVELPEINPEDMF